MPSFAQILMGLGQGRGLKPNQRPFASQAASETLLRYLPGWEALNAVREQSANTMRSGITQATSAAQLNAALARQGAKDFGGLPANPLPYEGAPGSSAAIAATNRGLTREGTLAMLATAANNAPIAAAQQIRQLQDKHADDLSQLGAQRGSLANQAGIFYSGRVGSLIGEERKSRAAVNAQKRSLDAQLRGQQLSSETTRRGQDITHADRQADRAAADRRAAAKPKGKKPGQPTTGPGSLTRKDENKYVSQINQVAGFLQNPPVVREEGKPPRKLTRAQTIALIRSGKSPVGAVDPRIINVGQSLADNKGRGIGPWGLKHAHNLGVHVNGRWKVLPGPRQNAASRAPQ